MLLGTISELWVAFFGAIQTRGISVVDDLLIFLLLMLWTIFSAAAIIVCVVALLGIIAAAGFLFFSGVTLNALLAGLLSRRPSTGLILFIIQISGGAGAIAGAIIGMVYSHLLDLPLWNLAYTGSGALTGGVLFALTTWMLVKVGLIGIGYLKKRYFHLLAKVS